MSFYPSAEIIADSINGNTGDRVTTFVLTYHRFVHSEFMTHRMFSRNASSSRSVSIERMIKKVIDQGVEPLHWGKNQKGMQARQELNNDEIQLARNAWNMSRDNAINQAKNLLEIGVHKQIVNRILEPFSTITVICTATDYQNFFNQRCHPDAQPEIQALAYEMKKAYEISEPTYLNPGEWHLPFIDKELINQIDFELSEKLIKVSTGRCARVSYLNHDGFIDIDADIKLHDRLVSAKPPHHSPLEHPVMCTSFGQYANLKGFKSYRYMIENSEI